MIILNTKDIYINNIYMTKILGLKDEEEDIDVNINKNDLDLLDPLIKNDFLDLPEL